MADGKPSTFDFKVKDVPDPVAKVGINKGGRMKVNDLKRSLAYVQTLKLRIRRRKI